MKPQMKFFARAAAKKGELYLYDDIGDSFFGGITPMMVADSLKELEGCTTLDVYVNSAGGDVFAGNTIYTQLKRFSAKKVVHIDGLAASIASIICMAGDQILMAKPAEMMIHRPFSIAAGESDDFRKTADLLDHIEENLVQTYVDRTGNKADDIKAWMKEETWMSAQQAMDRGFCDGIEEDATVAENHASVLLAKYRHTPAARLEKSQAPDVAIAKMEAYLLRATKAAAA